MRNNEGRTDALAHDSARRKRRSCRAFAGAALAAAVVFGAWWLAIRSSFAPCAAGTTTGAQAWLGANAVISALSLTAVAFLLLQQPAPVSSGNAALTHARLDGIIRSTTEAIITIDATQHIVMFNPMAEHVFRCAASDAIGTSLSRFIPERYRAAHERQVRQFSDTRESDRRMGAQRVLSGLRANGEEFPIEASISQTEDGEGKLLTVVLRDITDRVKAEAQLRQSREELRALSANLQRIREAEKTRIARELHDDLGQTLTALKMDIAALEAQLATHAARHADIGPQLQRMLGLIDRNIASLRRIAAHQRPVMLDDLGLHAAIDWLIDDFEHLHRIPVNHALDTGDLVFNADAATAVFRIIEEAFANIARHAHASRVELSLVADGADCVLRVADDGVGAPCPLDSNGRSFGLLDVRERANALGGRVFVDSIPDNGFVLTAVLPREAVQDKEPQP
ncbi:PAS domain-containing sensor histidine kinase [Caballeronia grimmiae]|uniref:PAS domain-containing sensor histidine kinase n=1 Tax=Caballeronia grimmiae TaxID=1071679 RepID=UPI0038BAC61B